MAQGTDHPLITDLFEQEGYPGRDWQAQDYPPEERFPLNIPHRQTVEQTVQFKDLYGSLKPLVVSGYGALDRLMDFVCRATDKQPDARIRIMFGHEPFPSRGLRISSVSRDLIHEAEEYWLERGISLLYSAHIVRTIDLLKSGQLQTRYMPGGTRLHAKIYAGDEAVTQLARNLG